MSLFHFFHVADPAAAESLLRTALAEGGWMVVTVAPAADRERFQEEIAGSKGIELPQTWPAAGLSASPVETLCVLDPGLTSLGWDRLVVPLREALHSRHVLTVLLRWAEPPLLAERSGGRVYSFVGPAHLLNGPDNEAFPGTDALCYRMVHALLDGRAPGVGLVVRQCDAPPDTLPTWTTGSLASPPTGSTAVVLSHRGPPHYLRVALDALAEASPPPEAIRVGLDVDDLAEYLPVISAHRDVEFFACLPAPAGPYVIRQALADVAAEVVLAFHDSDDLSCRDRFHWLHAEMARSDSGLVGSHELRFDETTAEVRAVRFPLDVTAALRVEPRHVLLHPTSMVRVVDFRRAGGFSTDCTFGNDTQFLLRAYFHMPIRNVDRFLYVRREWPGSLTTALETGMDNPVRVARSQAWRVDFEAVKVGRLRLEDSSLRAVPGRGPWWLRPIRAAAS